MSNTLIPYPPSDIIVDPRPVPPDALAAAWIARRCRLPIATANTVRELAQLGGLDRRGR